MFALGLACVVVTWLAYLIGFPFIYGILGASTTLLALIPIAATAGLLQRWGGLSSALLAMFVSAGQLYYVFGESVANLKLSLPEHYTHFFFYFVTGFIVGWLTQLRRELRTYKKVSSEAQYDALTGLHNRTSFVSKLEKVIANSKKDKTLAGVLFIDLDKFKYVNDTYGHDIGDELLKQVALLLKGSVRQGDVVARLGGDEFMLILSELQSLDVAALIADKIVRAISKPFMIQGREVRIGASVGVSVYPTDGTTPEDLIKAADNAMYTVKAAGKNSFIMNTSETRADDNRRKELEQQLHLGFNNQEFELYFQPQVNLTSRSLGGLEVLLRWRSPVLGLVTPNEFLPLAESAGLLLALDHWVLREACNQLDMWRREGYAPVKLSVNISALQFAQDDFVENVIKALNDFNLSARWLELEITEAVLAGDPNLALATIYELSNLGVSLTLDNYGSGYSSLAVLQQLPMNRLKIDKQFVHQLSAGFTSKGLPPILEGICVLGKKLNKELMIEGVESASQHKAALSLGCDMGQGYYYSKPLTAHDVVRLLKRTEPIKTQPSLRAQI